MLPIRQASPNTPATGGNLARLNHAISEPGLFLTPSRCPPSVPCSIGLSRNARSVRECGLATFAAKRADCMRVRRKHQNPARNGGFRRFSIFIQPAHQFRGDNADRNESGLVMRPGLCEAGAAGFLPDSPRPSPSFQVDNLAHRDGSFGSLIGIRESKRGSYAQKSKRLWNTRG